MQEIRNWTTTNFKNDFIPAYVDVRAGRPDIVVNASDMTGMSCAEAEALAAKRNADQIESARRAVVLAHAQLDAARAHLARVDAIFGTAPSDETNA